VALAASPEIVVLDEPLSSLDASAQAQVANLLKQLSRELHVGLLLISHDFAIVRHYLGQIVEKAPTSQLWAMALHPYTEALIEAVPLAGDSRIMPAPLVGEVPDPAYPPPGCRFHPRCSYSFDRCRTDWPPLLDLQGDRAVAWWLHGRGDALVQPSRRSVPDRAVTSDF